MWGLAVECFVFADTHKAMIQLQDRPQRSIRYRSTDAEDGAVSLPETGAPEELGGGSKKTLHYISGRFSTT